MNQKVLLIPIVIAFSSALPFLAPQFCVSIWMNSSPLRKVFSYWAWPSVKFWLKSSVVVDITSPGQCPTGSPRVAPSAQTSGDDYYWPTGRGRVGSYGVSPYKAVWNISVPTWSWHHPDGVWSTIPVGVSIDDKKDIYLTAADGIRKFNPDGKLLWTYDRTHQFGHETINIVATLLDGMAYCQTSTGRVFAVNMRDGTEIWSTRVSWAASGNYGWTAAHSGVVLAAADLVDEVRGGENCCGPSDHTIFGLNASTGCVLWEYKPEVSVWNQMFNYNDDGTFLFQDIEGRAYRSRISDGTNLWKAGGAIGTWTDGGPVLGPNGVAYAVNVATMGSCLWGGLDPLPNQICGNVSAYRYKDGELLWSSTVPKPPNNVPAVGRLFGKKGNSLVIPLGQQCQRGQRIDVYAFDADTGVLQWTYEGFRQLGDFVVGDNEGVPARRITRIQEMTMPNPWGAPTIDSDGIVYVGGETGHFLALKDMDGDGRVAGEDEVMIFHTNAAFVGSSGPALAPGIFAVGDISSLHVWKTQMP